MSCASRQAREAQGPAEAPERQGLRVPERREPAHRLHQPGRAELLDGPTPHRDPRQASAKNLQGPGRTPAMKVGPRPAEIRRIKSTTAGGRPRWCTGWCTRASARLPGIRACCDCPANRKKREADERTRTADLESHYE